MSPRPDGAVVRRPPVASVVVPAHDEERSIGRLLDALAPRVRDGSLELVVVCNGCTDRTADVARTRLPEATVVELARPSKQVALGAGDRTATVLPRVYVDADVVISGDDVLRLAERVGGDGPLAAAPERVLDTAGASRLVRGYYAVWSDLRAVRSGLYGRGVLAVGEQGYARIAVRPDVLGDDLVVDLAFEEGEREVVTGARSVVRVPRRTLDLVRRRVRAVEGNRQVYRGDGARDTAAGSTDDVRTMGRAAWPDLRRLTDLASFVAVTAAARGVARWRRWRGAEPAWHRDESSRG